MTFNFLKLHVEPGESGGEYKLLHGGETLCKYTSWGFSSCGIDLLHGFKNHYGDWWTSKENVAQLREWLRNNSAGGHWLPQEFYFALSCTQVNSGSFDGLIKQRGYVRKVDRFENKAHGPNDIHLFRWSLNKDFRYQ